MRFPVGASANHLPGEEGERGSEWDWWYIFPKSSPVRVIFVFRGVSGGFISWKEHFTTPMISLKEVNKKREHEHVDGSGEEEVEYANDESAYYI